jgi:tetratricopeptide (TPR) repeat protein
MAGTQKRISKPQPAARRGPPHRAIVLAGFIVIVATSTLWLRLPDRPVPPRLADLGVMDPDVTAFIGQQIDRVNAAREDPGAWAQLGLACEANGLVGAATRAFETAVALDANNPRWWYRLALLRSRQGDPAAMSALDRVVALQPGYGPAHWRLGLWLLDRSDARAAEAAFRRATEIDARDPGGWVGLALVHLSRREDYQAVAVLERLLQDTPGDRYALQLLGAAYRRVGRTDDAAFALAVGTRGEPVWRDPWSDEVGAYRRGFAAILKEATGLAMAGDFAGAIPRLEQLRTTRPDDLALLTQLGGVYGVAGRVADATALLESVLSRDPQNFDAHLNLAMAHVSARALDRAEVYADRALAIRPTSAKALETKGMILWRSGRPTQALPVLEAAVARDPRNAQTRVWIGLLLVDQQQARDALPHFEAALKTDPLLSDALVGMGRAQLQLGADAEAGLVLGRAEQIDPTNPQLAAVKQLLTTPRQPR